MLSLSFKDISSTLYLTGESRLSPHAHTHSTFPRSTACILRDCFGVWPSDIWTMRIFMCASKEGEGIES